MQALSSPSLSAVRFGAWQVPGAQAAINQAGQAFLDELENPSQSVTISPEDQRSIQAAKQLLLKMSGGTSDGTLVGFGEIRDLFRTLTATGYTPSLLEQSTLNQKLGGVGAMLYRQVTAFNPAGDYTSQRQVCSQAELTTLLKAWAPLEPNHDLLLKVSQAIADAAEFVGDAALMEAIRNRMDQLKTQLTNPPTRQEYLQAFLPGWQPKSVSEEHVALLLKNLLGDGVSPDVVSQAQSVISERNMKIRYAGLTASGQLYVITQSTPVAPQIKMQVFIGLPGALAPCPANPYYGSSGQLTPEDQIVLADGTRIDIKRTPAHNSRSENFHDQAFWQTTLTRGDQVDQAVKSFDYTTLPAWRLGCSG